MKVDFLRKKYRKFIYQKYDWRILKRNLKISFYFLIESFDKLRVKPDIKFKSEIRILNIPSGLIKRVGEEELNNLIFHLGLIEIPTYWKGTLAPEIEIKAGPLNKEQILWWKDLIINGMGQFFYQNKINFTQPNFLKIKSLRRPDLRKTCRDPTSVKMKNQILVPVGGGKDSVVTLEILKGAKLLFKELSSFSLNPTEAALKIMKIAGCQKSIIGRRKIDKKLFELNRQGFLNGHTPFSAYLAFLSVLVATIFGQKYIAFSNERSSNEGNLKYLPRTEIKSLVRGLGFVINHQWSKSFEFEKKFREYSKKYLAKNIEYFSFLRPLYEIQIARLFSKYKKYFSSFLSCNEAFRTYSGTKKPIRKWCGKCPKCLFVFAILYPFIEKENLIKIFGQNLFENPEGKPSASYGAGKNLLSIMQQLIGEKGFKPFECVGTKKESLVAFYLSFKKFREHFSEYERMPFLLKYFEKKILPKYPNPEEESKKILNSWNNQHNLPRGFEEILKSFTIDKNIL